MKALIVGATGLVGSNLLSLLLQSDHYNEIHAITRKPLPANSKLKQFTNSGTELEKIPEAFKIDDVYCCLGTTIKKAGSKEAFSAIDFDYPLNVAKLSLENGASQYLIVTALGSSSKSSIFYNRVKGEVEEALRSLGFKSLKIFQPSMLLGSRNEKRLGEDFGKVLFSILGFLLLGPFKKYKAVEGARVAKALYETGAKALHGEEVILSDQIQEYK